MRVSQFSWSSHNRADGSLVLLLLRCRNAPVACQGRGYDWPVPCRIASCNVVRASQQVEHPRSGSSEGVKGSEERIFIRALSSSPIQMSREVVAWMFSSTEATTFQLRLQPFTLWRLQNSPLTLPEPTTLVFLTRPTSRSSGQSASIQSLATRFDHSFTTEKKEAGSEEEGGRPGLRVPRQ